MEAPYGISSKGQVSLPCLYLKTIERNHQRDRPQLSKMMWRQPWCLFLVVNGAGLSFLVVLRWWSEISGLLHPPELCLLAQQLQWTARTWQDVHRDRVGLSGHAPSTECFPYSELLLLGVHKNAFIKTGIKFGRLSKVRAKQMLLSWGASFQLCVTTCALTPHLWHFHCLTRLSFWWQLSTLSSLLTPVSHSSSCFIIWFHFPHLLLPTVFHPIFPLVPYQGPSPVRVFSSLTTSNTYLMSFQQMSLEEPKVVLGIAVQVHKQNTHESRNSFATKLWPQK